MILYTYDNYDMLLMVQGLKTSDMQFFAHCKQEKWSDLTLVCE